MNRFEKLIHLNIDSILYDSNDFVQVDSLQYLSFIIISLRISIPRSNIFYTPEGR